MEETNIQNEKKLRWSHWSLCFRLPKVDSYGTIQHEIRYQRSWQNL